MSLINGPSPGCCVFCIDRQALLYGFAGMPPHMAPRPGMPHIAPAPAAGPIPSRPAVQAAQPSVTKPLFPSAAQVGIMQSALKSFCLYFNVLHLINYSVCRLIDV